MRLFHTSRYVPSFILCVVVSTIMLGIVVPAAMGQASVQGQWSTLPYLMPINPIHTALLHNGKVLIVTGSGNCPPSQAGCPSGPPYGPANSSGAVVWDPVTGTITQLTVAWDMFCNSIIVLPDGRAFINGGTLAYDPFHGEFKSSIFDPSNNTFTDVQSMAHGRWYPTLTTLGDGRIMTFSGLNETGSTNQAVEIYTVGSGWSQQYDAGWAPPLYPRMTLLPSGKVFYSGLGGNSSLFDPATTTWALNVASTNYGGARTYGSSVLLPLRPTDNYDPKVMILGGGNPATATTEIIDLGAPTLAWHYGPSMSQARIEMNATMLPNGKILALGGSVNDEDTSSKSLNADLYDPVANTFSSAGANAVARLYHSVSLLLPDATVWFAGGNPERGSYEQTMEIYKPPYLFNADGTLATRPTITSAPGSISYSNIFTVQTPNAATISSAVLVRPGSPTHAFDQEQRLVGMSFTVNGGALNITAPPNGNIAPPGYYMLFLLNSSGVPSVAQMVQLVQQPDTLPPTTPGNLTATAVGGSQINLSWTASTDNVGVTQYLVERCQGAGCTTFAQVGTSTGTTYIDTGLTPNTSYSYRVRATDAAGNLSGYSNTASTTTLAPDTQAPTAPSSLTATAVGGTQINLSWTASTDNVGVTQYLVERCQGVGCATFAQVGTSAGTTFNNTGLAPSASYSYRVRATDAAGNLSGYSNTASATTQATVPGLVAAYSFNEGTGTTVADASGTGNTGTVSNTTWTTSGKFGNALVFNGTTALVTIPDAASLRLTSGMTIEAWVNPSVVNGAWRDVIYKADDNYFLEGTSTNGSKPAGGGTWGSGIPLYGTAALTANTWAHLALTYDGANLRLYVNGTQVGSQVQTGNIATSANPLQIGGDSLYGQFFQGMIDEVRVYNVALTVAQIQSDMATPIGSGGGGGDTQAPTTPSNLTATAVNGGQVNLGQINLSWTASTDNVGVTQYLVERCQGAGCTTFAQVGTSAGTTFNDTGLTNGTSYSYRVRATDAAGNLSTYSNVATAVTLTPDTQAPTAPSSLTATAASGTQINLGWTASTDNVGVTGYLIERCQGAGCSTFAQVGTSAGTTFNDTGLTNATSYSYRVRATDAAGNLSSYSNTGSATTLDTQAPTAPSTLVATAAGGTQINLSWTASTDNVGVTQYLVERCQGAGCTTFVQVGTATGTTYNDAGLANVTSYSYRVRAADAAGNLSGYSNTASATTTDTQAPTAPGSLTATAISGTQINLGWTASTDNVGVTQYLVERCQGAGCTTFAQVGTSAGTTYNDTTLTANTSYSYRVRATDAAGNLSGYSNTATATTQNPDTQAPTAPSSLTATAISGTQINLSWTASTDNVAVTQYLVERCQGAGCTTFAQVGTTAGTTYNDTGLTNVTSYSYRVRATDAAGNLSGYSNTASATTTDTQAPTAPASLTATAAGGTQINLSWTASTDNVGVTQYLVERCQGAGCTTFAQVGTSAGTTFNDTGLTNGTSYSYRVRATDAAGNLSGYSNTASATTTDTQAPTAPASLTATAVGNSQINLSWTASTDNVGVTQYLVERCQGAGCTTFAQIGTSAGTTFNNTGLTTNTSYSYRVRATDAAGNLSGYSNTASATTQATIPGLVAAYSFNEGSGTTVADASGTGNNGTVANTTWTTSGKFGNALVFNGTSAKVTIPDAASLHLTSGMTLEVWVNPSTVNSAWRDVIYKADDNYYLEGTSSNGSRPGAGGTWGSGATIYGTTALTANTWAYLAVTYDGANLRLFVNGTQVSSQAQTGSMASSTNPLQIGGDTLYGQYFSGMIDEVRVYNVALTAAQIQSDMVTPIGSGGGGGDTQAPTAPSSLTATAISGTQINLSWTASTDNVGVTQYLVERCQGAGCTTFAQVGTSAGTTYNDTTLTANTSYSYRVRATDAAGNLSGYSNTASATTQNPDTQAPTAPSSLTATAISGTQINLSWTASTDNVGVTQYLVERCQGAGCSTFVQIGTSIGTTFNDTALTNTTSYSYRVRATDAAGNLSSYSNVASATTQSPDTQPPTAPANLTATAVSGSQINLGWTASTDNVGVTGYMIERCQGAGCSNWARIVIATSTTYSDTGLLPNTSYSYQVKATDAAGNFSAYSNTATTITLPTIPGLVAAYSFDEGSGTTVTDLSGNGNTGTLTNPTWTSASKYGNALVFDGASSLVTINDSASLHLTTAMTLEAWVHPSIVPASWEDVVYKGNDNYFLEATSTNGSVLAGGGTWNSSGATIYGTSALAVNTWTHLALTYDGANLRLYVNGSQVASQVQTGNLATSANPLQIGGDSLYGQYFAGTIDEVRVYNTALNPSQIQGDMATPVGGGGPLPLISFSPTSINFGNVSTGASNGPQPVTLTNIGGATLAITSVAVSGSNAGDFAQTNNCGTNLAPGGSCTINATFTPLTTGLRAAAVAITDNAPGSPHTIGLSGTGTGFAVTPRAAVLTSTMTQQFTAAGNVTWSVDGLIGGSPASGTITGTGLYTPPNSVGVHTVTATTTDQSQSASATAYITGYAGMFTHHNDNFRTGQNTNETVLSPGNVDQTQFGKLFSYAMDGTAFASPLYVANVNIPGHGIHNVVYVATEHDSVYAWDADGLSTSPLWKVSFLGSGVTTVPCVDTGECGDIPGEIGITGTPVIDQASGTLYVVAATKEAGATYVQRLHALDIKTGAEKFGGPLAIQVSVAGSGSGSQGGQLPFDTLRENQRPALVLSNGVLYIGWGSHGDWQPWHGWVLGYNPTTLQQVMVQCVTPDGYGGGIWASGGGLGADSSGNIYFNTGNGDFTANTGGRDYGDSVLKLSPSGTILDYFTPFDQGNMESQDLDLASAGPVLLLDQPGPNPHLLITAAKTGTIYVVNRDNMGHFNANNDNQIVQSLPGVLPHGGLEQGNFSAPAFFNGFVYFAAVNDTLKAFQMTGGLLSNGPTSHSLDVYPNRGGSFAVSGNGNTNGIVWAMQDNNPSNGVLHAYDAGNLANELYNTSQAGSRDTFGLASKFSVPLVANGKVFVNAQTQLVVFGLLP